MALFFNTGYFFTLQMEIAGPSGKLVTIYKMTWHHIPEDSNFLLLLSTYPMSSILSRTSINITKDNINENYEALNLTRGLLIHAHKHMKLLHMPMN
jgi:hypothetical protein